MSYREVFTEVKEIFTKADVSRVEGYPVSQFNTSGEGEDMFYTEAKDGALRAEPYEYYDRDAKSICSVNTLMKLVSGKLDLVFAFTTEKLKVEGSPEEVLVLQMFV